MNYKHSSMSRMEFPINNAPSYTPPSKSSSLINLFVTGDINSDLAALLAKDLIEIEDQNNNNDSIIPIQLIINSPGGDLFATWMICDIMSTMRTPILTLGLGQVASGGFMIFMNGTRGHRTATVNTHFMSHRFNMAMEGSHTSLLRQRPEMDRMHDRILNHYRRCSGLNNKDIEKYLLTDHDVFLTAQQCADYGICDNIVDTTGKPDKSIRRKIPKNGKSTE